MKAVVFGLAQVVVIVSGILAAGLTYRFLQIETGAIGFLIHYGYLILAVPLLWTTIISLLRHPSRLGEEIDEFAMASGLGLTVCLAMVLASIAVQPLLAATWGFGLQGTWE